MAASAGIWSGAAQPAAQSNASASDSSAPNSSNSAAISADDFLTLLVTEMQNQDPTAATDPNEYINQLVNVNSLQQLISINQTLQSATTAATGKATGSNTPHPDVVCRQSDATQADVASAPGVSGRRATSPSLPAELMSGNLSVQKTNPAAARVAQGLVER